VPDLLPEGINGPDGFCAQEGFELGKGHFDWIKIGTVGRQKQDPGAPGPDRLLGGFALMGRQIVHDDDIAFVKRRRELGLDIDLEDALVHWRVDDERGGEVAAAQPGDEGLRHPMPKRRLAAKPLALQTTAAQTDHLRRSSGLIHKDQTMRLKPHARLPRSPFLARPFDIGAILLACQQRFF